LLTGLRALKGGHKRHPIFMYRKRSATSAARLYPHYPTGNVVEGAAEIVKAITNRQRQVDWHLTGYNAERLNSSISVDLFNNSAEIALDEGFQDCPHFLDVAFGPGHL